MDPLSDFWSRIHSHHGSIVVDHERGSIPMDHVGQTIAMVQGIGSIAMDHSGAPLLWTITGSIPMDHVARCGVITHNSRFSVTRRIVVGCRAQWRHYWALRLTMMQWGLVDASVRMRIQWFHRRGSVDRRMLHGIDVNHSGLVAAFSLGASADWVEWSNSADQWRGNEPVWTA